jgi:predicted RNA binding protein with dsRBD fold (UPF0201 family)
MEEIVIHAEAEINPTESEEKVRTAINNIIGNATFTVKPALKANILCAETKKRESLIKLRSLLRNDRIRDAARKALNRAISGNKISFCLNKQVAFAGHVSFSEETAESPLGPIRITIETDNPRQVVDWLAEKTV